MTDFLKHYLEVYFLEKPEEAQKICQQVLVNKQSREHAEKTRQSIKKTLSTQIDHRQPGAEVRGLPHQGRFPPGTLHRGGRFRYGRGASRAGTPSIRPSCPSAAKS